jgi:4-hydroxybenzoate polyprenyltransferase
MSQADASPESSPLLQYLRLFRLPNLFTAMADVTMGFLCVHADVSPLGAFVCLVGASCLLYTAGMVLNDVYDAEVDAVERPERPIPSGHILLAHARRLGFGLLLGGLVCGWLAAWMPAAEPVATWRAGAVATTLACCIVLYDAVVKETWLGPFLMGVCRFLNVLLGMSLGAPWEEGWQVLGYGGHQLLVAGAIGVYVVGISWFARQETRDSRRWALMLALLVMFAGLGLLGLLHRWWPAGVRGLRSEGYWLLLLGLLGLTVVRRCGAAILEPSPVQVQAAVKHALQSLIVLDAAVTVEVNSLYYAVWILLLLFPAAVLGRWVYAT